MHASRVSGTPDLRLIHGDLDQVVYIGRVAIQLAPQERPPFAISAVAVEQDTALLLDDDPEFRLPHPSLSQLGEEMARFSAPQPGSVVVQRGTPQRFYAIIHDLEQEPSVREVWILTALEQLLQLTAKQPLPSLALPLLGSRFGQLAPERFLHLLYFALRAFAPGMPLRLWLVVPRHDIHRLLLQLRHYTQR